MAVGSCGSVRPILRRSSREGGLREILIILAAFASDVLSRFRRWFTVRRVLGIVAVLIVLLLFRQFLLLGMDISFLFGLDLGLVTEVTALMIILSVRHRVMTATYVVRHWLLRTKPVGRFLRRGIRRAFRSRPAAPLLPPPPDDEPAVWAFA